MRTSRVNAILGTTLATPSDDLSDRSASRSSRSKGAAADTSPSSAPTSRPDLEREIDLVEEVGRRIGSTVSCARCRPQGQVGALTPRTARTARVADALGRGRLSRPSRCRSSPGRHRRVPACRSMGWSGSRIRCAPRSRCCAPRILQALLAALGTTVRTARRRRVVRAWARFYTGRLDRPVARGTRPLGGRDRDGADTSVRRRPAREPADAVARLHAVADALRWPIWR